MIELRTARLRLAAATREMAEAGGSQLANLLRAELPAVWPPPLNDDDSARFFAEYVKANPDAVGWTLWYFVLENDKRAIAIGNGGFKGKPVNGTVEVGYSIVPEFQRRGYATEAVGALIAWAFGHPEVERVIAETFPEFEASQAVLRRLGFKRLNNASEPGLLRFEVRRALNSDINEQRASG